MEKCVESAKDFGSDRRRPDPRKKGSWSSAGLIEGNMRVAQ